MSNLVKRFLENLGYTKAEREVLISSGPSTEWAADEPMRRVSLKDLEFYYRSHPPTKKGVDLKAASTWGRGMGVLSDDKEAEKLAQEIIDIPGFKEYIVTEIGHAFVYGDGWLENIWDDVRDKKGNLKIEGKKIIGFAITDPKTIKPKWDEYGNITEVEQKLKNGVKGKTFPPRKFTHFKFSSIADSVTGVGLIEPLVPTINALMMSGKSTSDLIFRHGVPFTHLVKKGATARDIPKLKKVAANLSSSKCFASSELYEFKFYGVQGQKIDIAPHLEFLKEILASGLGMPKPLLFQAGEGENRATLEILSEWNQDETRMNQEKVASIIENQIFGPVMKANDITTIPQVIWEDINPKAERETFENQLTYVRMLSEAVRFELLTIEKARDLLEVQLSLKEEEEIEEGTKVEAPEAVEGYEEYKKKK